MGLIWGGESWKWCHVFLKFGIKFKAFFIPQEKRSKIGNLQFLSYVIKEYSPRFMLNSGDDVEDNSNDLWFWELFFRCSGFTPLNITFFSSSPPMFPTAGFLSFFLTQQRPKQNNKVLILRKAISCKADKELIFFICFIIPHFSLLRFCGLCCAAWGAQER